MTLKPPGPHMEASARVKAICDMAAGVSVNPETNPKHYLRSGRELIRTAACYQEDGQTEHAYVLYMRFLTIFLEKLRLHPNYKDVPMSERKVMMDYCNKILPQAEYLKNELLKKYEKDHEEYLVQTEKLRQQAEEQRQRELEAQKRHEEEKAKDRNTRGLPSYGDSGAYTKDPGSHKVVQPSTMPGYAPSAPVAVDFPTELFPQNDLNAPTGLSTGQPQFNDPPSWQYDPTPVQKIREPEGPHHGANIPSGSVPTPSVDRSTKPSRMLTPMSSGLRPLVIPAGLPEMFLRYAESNTAKNVETCGLLTGKISGTRLIITDLIIPKQTGSSDTCTMLNETEIFNLQDKYNLISFGWIHTHPTQTAFLSSIDMHTHYSYQVMMPEAIAIVCAPKHNQTGVFTLTPYEGMQEIGSCTQSGFHPHKPNGLFCDAPHCSLDASMQTRVHDLR